MLTFVVVPVVQARGIARNHRKEDRLHARALWGSGARNVTTRVRSETARPRGSCSAVKAMGRTGNVRRVPLVSMGRDVSLHVPPSARAMMRVRCRAVRVMG